MSDDDIWYRDTTEHVTEIRALREKVAALEADADRWRRLVSVFGGGA